MDVFDATQGDGGQPLLPFAVAVFGFLVLMIVWLRSRRSRGAR